MALAGTVLIKNVTISNGVSVAVLAAMGLTTAGSYTVMIYSPQSESLNLSLADAAGGGGGSDPEATIPAQDNPFVIDSTSSEVYLYNGGAVPVSVRVAAWTR